MKKPSLLIILVTAILVLVTVGACTQPAQPTATATQPATTTAKPTTTQAQPTTTQAQPTTTQAKPTTTVPATTPASVIKLKFHVHSARNAVYAEGLSWIVRELEKRSGGRIKAEYYYAAVLLSSKEALPGIAGGVADVGVINPSFFTGDLPLTNVGKVPFIVKDIWSGSMAAKEFAALPEVKAEQDKNNIVHIGGGGQGNLKLLTSKPVRALADFKGLKISTAAGAAVFDILANFGASPMSIVATELYEALQKKIVDGNVNNPAWVGAYKYWEVAKFWTELSFGGSMECLYMNKNYWNKLPADIQQMITGMIDEQAKAYYEIYEVFGDGTMWDTGIVPNCEVIKLSEADLATWQKAVDQLAYKRWLEDTNAKGLPAQKMLDNWLALNKKYQAQTHPAASEVNNYKQATYP